MDSFYDEFVSRVAGARGLSKAEVDRVAQGRVWTGAQALERKLVDRLGGFDEALAEAKRRAGLDPDEDVELDDEEPVAVDFTDLAGATALDAVPLGADSLGIFAKGPWREVCPGRMRQPRGRDEGRC